VAKRQDDQPSDGESSPIQLPATLASRPSTGIQIGDRVVIRYLDDNKTASLVISHDRDDLTTGKVSALSPLGKQLVGSNEEDEVEFETNGRIRKVLVVRTEREGYALQ